MSNDLRGKGVHNLIDLELLVTGDVVNLIYQDLPKSEHPNPQLRAAFYLGLVEPFWSYRGWIYQAIPHTEQISLVSAKPTNLSFDKGIIVFAEDRCVKTSFTLSNKHGVFVEYYKSLRELLKYGGIWEDAN